MERPMPKPKTKNAAKHKPLSKNLVALDGTLDSVDRIGIRVVEKGRSPSPYEIRVIHKDAVRERIDCSNPLCEGGGISLGDILLDMVRSRQTDFIGTSFCTGEEVLHPEVPEPVRSCRNRFEIEATLRFRN
jgi:hypothetical protein